MLFLFLFSFSGEFRRLKYVYHENYAGKQCFEEKESERKGLEWSELDIIIVRDLVRLVIMKEEGRGGC